MRNECEDSKRGGGLGSACAGVTSLILPMFHAGTMQSVKGDGATLDTGKACAPRGGGIWYYARQQDIPHAWSGYEVKERLMGGIASPGQLRVAFLRWAAVTVPAIVLLGTLS